MLGSGAVDIANEQSSLRSESNLDDRSAVGSTSGGTSRSGSGTSRRATVGADGGGGTLFGHVMHYAGKVNSRR